ncbi:MAG TPA: cobalamin-dependent protein [Pedococcus sp.]|nr:cobalamin-dependent protein [Pedococcus sp.]
MYTIRHASVLTGVPVATLRAWERRYGVVHPARTDAGYRLYDERALQVLSAMAELVSAGWSPRQAAEQVAAADGEDTTEGLLRFTRSSVDQLELQALSRAAAAQDPEAVERALDEAFAVDALEVVVDGWLMPALHLLGTDWHDGRVDVAGEHLVSAAVHRRLGAALDAAGRETSGPRVIVGLGYGVRHELGILAFAVLLRRTGIDVAYLGADLPTDSWVQAVRHHRPDAIVMAAPMGADVVAIRETADAVHALDPNVPIYVGGSAQAEIGGPARPLGHSLRAAAEELSAAVGSS